MCTIDALATIAPKKTVFVGNSLVDSVLYFKGGPVFQRMLRECSWEILGFSFFYFPKVMEKMNNFAQTR